MDMSYVEIAKQFIGDYWPHVTGVLVPAVATAIFAHIRRPKSTARDTGPYFTEAKLLTPPLVRPAYSDRMAYVLAEMSDLAYYQFEGEGGFIEDAVQAALERNLTDGQDIRQFLDQFSTELMSGRRLSLDAFGNVLGNSGFSLVDVINIRETQGFVCKRNVADEPPYLVLAFRGTEKKISDWLTDARCIPVVEGKTRVHSGFVDAFTRNVDAEGRTVEELVREILDRPEARDERGTPLPLFITGHSLGGALALLATKLIAPDVTGACYTFGAPRIGNYELFRFIKTPVYRVVNSSDVVPRVPPGAVMLVLTHVVKGASWLTGIVPPVSLLFDKLEELPGQAERIQTLRRLALPDRCRRREVRHRAAVDEPAGHRQIDVDRAAHQPQLSRTRQEPQHEHLPQEARQHCERPQQGARRIGLRDMSNGKLLRQLIRSGAEGDLDAFRGVAKQVIADERQKQHHLLANDLETILYGRSQTPSSPALRNLTATIPEDRERGIPLLSVCEPVRGLEDVVLSSENLSAVKEILREHNREEVLRAHGLRPSDRVLFCGPPGCGKTLTAEVIASELGRPLAIVRTDSVVSSFLGETAANLRKVFDFVAASPMVALFDEFDALGKEREDASEHGELRRVVNAVLQMLDAYEGRSLIIAATNHEGMLDSAIWRRFEEVLVLKPPTVAQLRRLLSVKLRGVRREFAIDDVVGRGWFKGATHADVERVLRRALKEMVLQGSDLRLRIEHLEAARRRENARRHRARTR